MSSRISEPSCSTTSTSASKQYSGASAALAIWMSSGRMPSVALRPAGRGRAASCAGQADLQPRRLGPHLAAVVGQRHVGEVHRRRADEARHEAVGRGVVELERLADLLDHAVLHHHHPVAQGHRLDLVVGDVDRGGAQPLVQLLELDPHLHAQLGVEVAERLVEQEHLGIAHDGAAQRHALALAAGELARLAVQQGSSMPRMSAARLMRFSISAFSNFRIFRPNAMLPATLMCG